MMISLWSLICFNIDDTPANELYLYVWNSISVSKTGVIVLKTDIFFNLHDDIVKRCLQMQKVDWYFDDPPFMTLYITQNIVIDEINNSNFVC